MSTALTVYDNVQDPLAFVERFGTMIAKSRMFGCENESQGKILAMACIAEKQNPIAIKRTYHIIDGNLSMRSDAMLAELRNRGGSHKVVERTDSRAEIEITFQGQTIRESLSWDEAKAEPWPFRKDGKTLKTNWATPRARRQMLWARVSSEAVRTIAPEIVAGVYTPEEASDFDQVEEIQKGPVDVDKLPRETAAKAASQVDQTEGEPIDAEFVVVPDPPEQDVPKSDVQPDSGPTAEVDQVGGSTADQRSLLRQLFDTLGATDEQINKALAKRGVKSMRQLSHDQAAEIITTLEAKAAAAAAEIAGQSRLPPDATSSDVTGPVGEPAITQCKKLMEGDFELARRVKAHLNQHGKQKIAELSHEDGIALLESLKSKNMELFFARSLAKGPF